MITLIYLHGYGSAGNGSKLEKLKMLYPGLNVVSPTLNIDPVLVVKQVEDIFLNTPGKKIVIGTSLGGFYASYFAALYDTPSIIINPLLNPNLLSDRLDCKHIQSLLEMKTQICKSEKDSYYFSVVIGGKDERLTYEELDIFLPRTKTKVVFDNENHRFEHIELIKPLIDDYLKEN